MQKWPGRGGPSATLIFHPDAGRFRWARNLQEDGKLLRISILRLVENDAIIFVRECGAPLPEAA